MNNIRNFVIIAHIDHGKSTLADRMLEMTGTIAKRNMKAQFLDQLDLEQERGITIKMAPVRMHYKDFILNLIDTPGHNDFKYEVSRALEAVEGAVLLVDVTQGIQAQTLANFENARRAGIKIIGAVNKVDLNTFQAEEVIDSLAELIGVDSSEILKVSGKTGLGVPELLDRVIRDVPPPAEPVNQYSRALIFDSMYDEHKGVIAFVRVFDGSFKFDQGVKFLATGATGKIKEVGYFLPKMKEDQILKNGEIGYIATGLKDPELLKIGDTIAIGTAEALAGYKEPQPVVFVSFYPEDGDDYENLKKALGKLHLTDSALKYEPESSEVLGRGFKAGFLGRLHFEIIAERLEREFDMATVHSFPSVSYRVRTKADGWYEITNPKDFPADYEEVEEPMTRLEIFTPPEYMGGVLALKEFFRFSDFETKTVGKNLLMTTKLPLADLISDLDDRLKSITSGYASLTYEIIGFEKGDLAKMEVMVAANVVPGLTRILPKEKLEREARQTAERLRDLLPKQQFTQAIQVTSNGRIMARETISAMKKDVTGYLYGGDRTRKMKLWKKQQKGKVRLKERGEKNAVTIPASIFKDLLKK